LFCLMRHIIAVPVRGPAKFWQRILHPFRPVTISPVVGVVLLAFLLGIYRDCLSLYILYAGIFLLG